MKRRPRGKSASPNSRKGGARRRARSKRTPEPEYMRLGEPIPGGTDYLYGRHKLEKLEKRR